MLSPAGGGEERILISVSPSTTADVAQLTQYAVAVTVQAFPALRPDGPPRAAGAAHEVRYTGNGAVAWQSIALRQGQAVGVTAIARPDRMPAAEQAARGVAASLRVIAGESGGESAGLARVIVGRWTWSHQTWKTGSVSRVVTFFPNGRFELQAATMMSVDVPVDVDPTTRVTGAYRVSGNTVFVRADNGQTTQYAVQVVEGGRGLKVNGDLYIRE